MDFEAFREDPKTVAAVQFPIRLVNSAPKMRQAQLS
jgi:hypothetical protein